MPAAIHIRTDDVWHHGLRGTRARGQGDNEAVRLAHRLASDRLDLVLFDEDGDVLRYSPDHDAALLTWGDLVELGYTVPAGVTLSHPALSTPWTVE